MEKEPSPADTFKIYRINHLAVAFRSSPGMDSFRLSAKPRRLCGALQDLVWTLNTSPVIHFEAHPIPSSVPEAGSPSPHAHKPSCHLFTRSYFCILSLFFFHFFFFVFVCVSRLKIRLCQWRMTTRGSSMNVAWMR